MIMKMELALPETDNSLVAKRLRHIERQRALRTGGDRPSGGDKPLGLSNDAPFAGQTPRGTGPLNRHGMPKLPTGQRQVPN